MWPEFDSVFDAICGLSLLVFYFVVNLFFPGNASFPLALTKNQRFDFIIVIQFDLKSPQSVKQLCLAKSTET